MSNSKTIENLQKAMRMEMTASHQYQLHAHVLDDWGLDLLADKMREEMEEELGHSSKFIERILFLGGTPEIDFYKTPQKSDSLLDMFKADLADEEEAIRFYTEAARHAYEENDIGTRAIFEELVLDEEGHKEWLDLQISLIDRLGEVTYTAKQMSGPAHDGDD